MANLKLVNVTKIYNGKIKAVNNVNIFAGDGEFIVLVGPSGCGKTTILRMIAGLEEITEGELYIDDKLMNYIPPKDRDIAMVFQNYALYPHMTVFENMAFGLKLRKFSKNEINGRILKAAKILDLENYLNRKPRALSGGQMQRVALGRAIVRNPKIFLFDEPLSNLDAKLRVQMRTEISKLHNRLKSTMVYVTHDQTEAMTMGNKIVVLNNGEVQQIGKPMELYNHPVNKFVAGFIGSPAMNFINGKIINENMMKFIDDEGLFELILNDSQAVILKNYSGKNITLGFRPEDILISHDNNSFSITPEVVEPMGNETFIYFSIAHNPVVGRLNSKFNIKKGVKLNIKIDTQSLYFFDVDTKQNIFLTQQF